MTRQSAQDLVAAIERLIDARIESKRPGSGIEDGLEEFRARDEAVSAIEQLVARERT